MQLRNNITDTETSLQPKYRNIITQLCATLFSILVTVVNALTYALAVENHHF